MDDSSRKLAETLKRSGNSLTKVRLTVFLALLDQEPLTTAELIKRIGSGIDRASIYRTVSLFETLGIMQRLQMGWKYRLELSDDFAAHHHHLTCTSCGVVEPIQEDDQTEEHIQRLARNANFQASSHQLEIRGLCHKCIQPGN